MMEALWRKSIPDQGDHIPGMYKEAKSGISKQRSRVIEDATRKIKGVLTI